MKLDKDIVAEVSDTLKDASKEKLERVDGVIENSDVSEEVKEAFKESVSTIDKEQKIENSEKPEKEENEKMEEKVVEDVAAALSIPGMQQYIDSLIKEAIEQNSKETSEEKISEEEDLEKQDSEEQEKEEEKDDSTGILVDSIVSCALSLKASEINQEDIEGSSAKYRESLGTKSKDELKSLHSDLITKVKELFTHKPSESLEKETLVEDSPSGNDEEKPASDTQKVLQGYFN
jgi:hypothetical protein